MSKYETFYDLGKAINQLSDNAQENDRYWQLKREAQALTGRSTKAHNDLLELGIQAYVAGLKPVHLHVAAQALNCGGAYIQLWNNDSKPVDKFEAGKKAAKELEAMLHQDRVRKIFRAGILTAPLMRPVNTEIEHALGLPIIEPETGIGGAE